MAKKVIILVVVLAIVGVLVVLTVMNNSNKTPTTNTPVSTDLTTKAQTNPATATTQPQKSQAEVILASAPGEKATQAELGDYSSKAFQAAVKTDTLDVTSCSPNPSVISLKPGQSITVVNKDTVAHTLVHSQDFNVTVPAQGSKTVNVPSGLGVYGYSCDGKLNGILFISQ